MNRRRLLGAIAGLGGLGGCLAGSGATDDARSPGDGTPTDETPYRATPTDAPPTADGSVAASVRELAVTPAFVALNSPDSIGTFGDRDEQFVVAVVAGAGDPPPAPREFALEAGGETRPPELALGTTGRHLWEYGEAYGERHDGWLAFRARKPLDAGDPAITWPGGRHALGEAAVERLARPPTEFSVTEFAVPDAVAVGEDATVELAVENVGDAAGTFVGALNRSGPWVAYTPAASARLELAPGETGRWEHTHAVRDRDDVEAVPEMRFTLNWRGDSRSRAVEVEAVGGGDG